MNPLGKCITMILVILIHCSIFVSCSYTLKEKHDKAERDKAVPMRWVEKDQHLLGITGNGLACVSKYRGIGVRTSWGDREVVEVAQGGPADVAGVKLGDTLVSDEYFGAYSIGEKIIIVIERNHIQMKLPVVINDICYEQ